jgi:hypothetical protein
MNVSSGDQNYCGTGLSGRALRKFTRIYREIGVLISAAAADQPFQKNADAVQTGNSNEDVNENDEEAAIRR